MASFRTARQFPHSKRVLSPWVDRNPTRRLSHCAQPVVGSLESGSERSKGVSGSMRPVFSLLISKVLRQSAQTWLKQHLGSQEYTISRLLHCGHAMTSLRGVTHRDFILRCMGWGGGGFQGCRNGDTIRRAVSSGVPRMKSGLTLFSLALLSSLGCVAQTQRRLRRRRNRLVRALYLPGQLLLAPLRQARQIPRRQSQIQRRKRMRHRIRKKIRLQPTNSRLSICWSGVTPPTTKSFPIRKLRCWRARSA